MDQDVEELGLNALWKMSLTSPSEVADVAHQDLLMLYDEQVYFDIPC
jgi:hypothetical protein